MGICPEQGREGIGSSGGMPVSDFSRRGEGPRIFNPFTIFKIDPHKLQALVSYSNSWYGLFKMIFLALSCFIVVSCSSPILRPPPVPSCFNLLYYHLLHPSPFTLHPPPSTLRPSPSTLARAQAAAARNMTTR